MSVKRVSGGGGQGRRPGRDEKGVHYFGAGYAPPTRSDMIHAQETIQRIEDRLRRASRHGPRTNHPGLSLQQGREELSRLSTVLHDHTLMTEHRVDAIQGLVRLLRAVSGTRKPITLAERKQLGYDQGRKAEAAFLNRCKQRSARWFARELGRHLRRPPA